LNTKNRKHFKYYNREVTQQKEKRKTTTYIISLDIPID